MREECLVCHTKTVHRLIDKYRPSEDISTKFTDSAKQLFVDKGHETNPMIATHVQRLARTMIDCSNLYKEEKHMANELLLEQYGYWRKVIENSPDPMHAAAKLAVAGNVIDYGAHSVPADITSHITQLFEQEFAVDQSAALFENIKKAGSILYLGDNAGEIVFDKMFIETMDHSNITYVVRGMPVINDVTFEDVRQVGIDKLCKVISNGYDAPSTLLEYCSEEFMEVFNSADLIISKGQGNFEGLMDSTKDNIFFMLMAKCKPIASLLDVEERSMLITKNKEFGNVSL